MSEAIPLSRAVARLGRDQGGSVAVMFAVCLLTIMTTIGLAIDYGRKVRHVTAAQTAADSASLAATRYVVAQASQSTSSGGGDQEGAVEKAKAMAARVFAEQYARVDRSSAPNLQVTISQSNGAWTTKVDVSGTLTSAIAGLFGYPTVPLVVTSSATQAQSFSVLDIAMCLDSTGSMQPTLEAVKANAMAFYDNMNAAMRARKLPEFPLVRVRAHFFRDYSGNELWDPARLYGGGDAEPMRESAFFSLPDQKADFDAFVSPQMASDGGDTPEAGVECLNSALNSAWLHVGDVPSGYSTPITDVYSLVVVWTDAPAKPVGFGPALTNPNYPPASFMPRSYAEILAKWNDDKRIDQRHKQIIFFGDPDITSPDQPAPSGWLEVKQWPRFVVGGTLTEGNVNFIDRIADSIGSGGAGLRLSQ